MCIKEILKKRQLAVGTMLCEFYSPNAPAVFKESGFDFFIIDCEHGCYDFTAVSAMIAAARNCGVDPVVRIPQIDKASILRYLEMGAKGLLVPMVSTAEQAREVVEYSRYAPLGARGISTRRAHNDFNSRNLTEYMMKSNHEITLMLQIETKEALANLESIAAVEGIDALMIGPTDLSSALGDLNNFTTEKFRQAVDNVIATAKNHGLHSGMITSDIQYLLECRKKGMDIISWNSEIGMIISKSTEALTLLKKS